MCVKKGLISEVDCGWLVGGRFEFGSQPVDSSSGGNFLRQRQTDRTCVCVDICLRQSWLFLVLA